jgi:hypothetical protein
MSGSMIVSYPVASNHCCRDQTTPFVNAERVVTGEITPTATERAAAGGTPGVLTVIVHSVPQ